MLASTFMDLEIPNDFIAIDFETADPAPDSACAVGLIEVRGGVIRERHFELIRPPRKHIVFSYIHGIKWEDVADRPTFGEIWPTLSTKLGDFPLFIAHNAGFDRRVLEACCVANGLEVPKQQFLCTVQIARKTWNIFPTRLPHVSQHLGIALDHHQALSDAEACAQIAIRARIAQESGERAMIACGECKPMLKREPSSWPRSAPRAR